MGPAARPHLLSSSCIRPAPSPACQPPPLHAQHPAVASCCCSAPPNPPARAPGLPTAAMATARIDLGALQRQLDSFQAKFQGWATRTVAGAEARRDAHLARLRECQGARGWGGRSVCAGGVQLSQVWRASGVQAALLPAARLSRSPPPPPTRLAAAIRGLEQQQSELEQRAADVRERE